MSSAWAALLFSAAAHLSLAHIDITDCSVGPDKGFELLKGPDSDGEAPAWRANMTWFRQTCKKAHHFASTALDEPELQWAQTSYVQTQMHAFDRYFYDDSAGDYTVNRFLNDLSNRYGGIDAMLLWPTYTNLGLDDRNQFDLIRALPGGIPRLKEVVADLKSQSVRVLLPYNPWDTGTRREGVSDADALAQLIADVDADGFNGDTMDYIGREFYDAGLSRGLKLAIEPEQDGTPAMANYSVLHWAYWGQPPPLMEIVQEVAHKLEQDIRSKTFDIDMVWDLIGHQASLDKVPGVDFFKWANDARHMTHACERFSSNKTDYLQVAFFNGVGFESWENVWGIWNQMTDRDSEALRRSATILRFFGRHRYLQSQDWQPHTIAKQPSDDVYVSEFPKGANDRVFLAVNRGGRPASGILHLPHPPANASLQYFNCYTGDVVHPEMLGEAVRVTFDVEVGGFGCILASDSPPDDLHQLLGLMAEMSVTPLSSFDAERHVLKQTMVTQKAAATPTSRGPDMVEVPATMYDFKTAGVEIEPFSDTLIPQLKMIPQWMFPWLADKVPVDVQFPWEPQPTRYHRRIMHVPRFFIDKHLVNVHDYAAYLKESGYVPKDKYNWLKNWNHSTSPPTPPKGKPPVTYISLREARAYCAFHGRRLPHDWEWQYAAQGHDGRQYPWGASDNSSMHPRVVNGGALPDAEDVGSYPQAASPFGVEDLVGHAWQFTDEFFDNHTRAVLLRGGSYYQPTQSRWYFPATNLSNHGKYFLMSDSYERAGTLGVRCVAEPSKANTII